MDVVRITQALRQQQPSRCNSSRSGSSSNTMTIGTGAATASAGLTSSSDSTSTSPTETSSFFSLPSSFSLSSLLPAAIESTISSGGGGLFSTSGAVASSAGARLASSGSSMGEMEVQSLLLRSMPMFGNLISKD